MSGQNMYALCQQHLNKAVEIRCHDGTVHRGIITKVDPTHVYLRPLDGDGADGPGVYAWGWAYWGIPIALASIAAISLWPWFWW
ncbi:hypothetical protein JOD45_001848 [Scopulibacillus daqui]|uniref:Uncharacterized protein n=1 Tax=Scopulibacillus daqui TaxID=1469162 RepID=A0ABS2Q1A1_9BACL|nr:hypothetical protein [Scopulibacillus daqui]MBM7645630.1 hypothetical protein [Scopulibacillus daqui]